MGQKHTSDYDARTLTLAGGVNQSTIISSARPIQSVQISWDDAIAAATAKIYTSNLAIPTAPGAATPDLEEWKLEPVTVVGAVASAKGCDVIHMSGNGAKHTLIHFVPTAAGTITVTPHERGN